MVIDDTTSNVPKQVSDAFAQLSRAAAGCAYSLTAADGGALDATKLNVGYSAGAGKQSTRNVAGAAQCPSGSDAWYFDSATSPTSVILCPATCAKVMADSTAEVDLLTGCPTAK
jgi:hypothetical protein